MTSQHLRIGNYIMDSPVNGDEPLKVEAIYSNLVIHGERHIYNDEIRPIPLTDEWFLDFGFAYNEEWDVYKVEGSDIGFRIHPHSKLANCYLFYNDSMSTPQWGRRLICIKNIEFVHQLQNIYHSLIGEELKINL